MSFPVESKYTVFQMTGPEKTDYLRSLVYSGSYEPMVRRVVVDLMRGLHRDDHAERLVRLHRFVRDSVPYHRESIEMFHHPTQTLTEGGDCDDHALLLCSLAWCVRYPFQIETVGDPEAPAHYCCALGFPPHDDPAGDANTEWRYFETIVDALPGEHISDAIRRIDGVG
jgi:transglutaminase-like putative cysteine protease